MSSILVPIIVVLALILVALVLVQKSKGGGLAAGFQSANSTLGAPKTATFLEKGTWYIMGAIAVLCIICTLTTHKGDNTQRNSVQLAPSAQVETPENIADDVVEVPAEATAE